MINVLFVDDNIDRYLKINKFINKDNIHCDIAISKNTALKKMQECQYDLVIIDIVLPISESDTTMSKLAGQEIISDILALKRLKKTLNIIGVTSDIETYNEVKSFFENNLIPIFLWEESIDDIKEKIKSKINYLELISTHPHFDIAIITAVEEEYNSVKCMLDGWEEFSVDNDPTIYLKNSCVFNEKKNNILLVKLPQMGMVAAASMTTKILLKFDPSKIFMVGICGGIKGEVDLCDLIVSSVSWDYGSGKIIEQKDNSKKYYTLLPSPNQIDVDVEIIEKIEKLTDNIITQINNDWNSLNPKEMICSKLHIGPLPSGASVICDENLFKEIIKPQHRKSLGLDMETYGVYYAINNCTNKDIKFISVKAVSDYADSEKSDNFHEACCYVSSKFLFNCLTEGIL